jgi:hypothetical protein
VGFGVVIGVLVGSQPEDKRTNASIPADDEARRGKGCAQSTIKAFNVPNSSEQPFGIYFLMRRFLRI